MAQCVSISGILTEPSNRSRAHGANSGKNRRGLWHPRAVLRIYPIPPSSLRGFAAWAMGPGPSGRRRFALKKRRDLCIESLGPRATPDATPIVSGAFLQPGLIRGTRTRTRPRRGCGGRHDEPGPASDVYSLGAPLSCLLTGQPPSGDGDLVQVLRKVERGEFRPPRAVNAHVDRGLDAICRKAMAPTQHLLGLSRPDMRPVFLRSGSDSWPTTCRSRVAG
jgi:serine/threonine protein kinase